MSYGRRWGAVVAGVFAALALAPPLHAASPLVLAPGQPLQIAVPVDQTTPGLGPLGTAARNAVQLAIESHPQIKGFAVQQDDVAATCFDPTANAAAAAAIVANPDVAGVVGHLCSGGLAGALPVYEAAGVVVLTSSATNQSLATLGPSVLDRTVVNDADGEASWLAAVEQLPFVLAWQQRYKARFGVAPTTFAELYFDAANLLLRRIEQVATLDPAGDLVIDRRVLAAAVRHTTSFRGVSCFISLDAVGNRFNDLGSLAACG